MVVPSGTPVIMKLVTCPISGLEGAQDKPRLMLPSTTFMVLGSAVEASPPLCTVSPTV